MACNCCCCGGYNDSEDIAKYIIRSEVISPTLKKAFQYELLYTNARYISGDNVVIIEWADWKQFCIFLQQQKKAEAKEEQKKSNLISNSKLDSRLENLEKRFDEVFHEQANELAEKDQGLFELHQELQQEKVNNQNMQDKLGEVPKLKQIKRLLHKIQTQKNWKKKQPQVSAIRASKSPASKVKQRLCYCCRRKGHLAKDCPFSSNHGPSSSEPVVVNSISCVRNNIPAFVSTNSTSVSAPGTSTQVPDSQPWFKKYSWIQIVLLFYLLFCWLKIASRMYELTFPP